MFYKDVCRFRKKRSDQWISKFEFVRKQKRKKENDEV